MNAQFLNDFLFKQLYGITSLTETSSSSLEQIFDSPRDDRDIKKSRMNSTNSRYAVLRVYRSIQNLQAIKTDKSLCNSLCPTKGTEELRQTFFMCSSCFAISFFV